MLWALLGRPRLILPDELWKRFDDEKQDAVLAHELAHLRRGDHWVRRLEAVALGLYWWDPIAWWARREVERSEELCCDAWVTWRVPGYATTYAEALVATAEFLSGSRPRPPWPLGASGVGRVPLLKGRLSMILRTPISRPAPRFLPVLAALALPLLPAWASGQTAAEKPKQEPVPSSTPKQVQPTAANKPKTVLPAPDALPPGPGEPGRVKVAQPIVRRVEDYSDYIGRIEAAQSVEIRSIVGGAVAGVEISPGLMVGRGQTLFKLDARRYQVELERAQALLQSAQRLNRLAHSPSWRNDRMSAKDKFLVPEVDRTRALAQVSEATADVALAKSALDMARLDLASANVTAPFAGKVVNVSVNRGEVVAANGRSLATIISVDPVCVFFDVDESTILSLQRLRRAAAAKPGASTKFKVEVQFLGEANGRTLAGEVDSLPDRLDPRTGTARVRVILPNKDGDLIPGMSARVRLMTGLAPDLVLVPTTAIKQGERWMKVLRPDGKLESRQISLGRVFEEFYAVEGLKPGEWFAVDYFEAEQRGRPFAEMIPERISLFFPSDPKPGPDRNTGTPK